MFLRKTPRKKDGKTHDYWSVVENKRVAGGRVVQRHVLYLGEINSSQAAVWRKAIEVLDDDAGHPRTLSLFPEDRCEGVAPDTSIVQLRLSDMQLWQRRTSFTPAMTFCCSTKRTCFHISWRAGVTCSTRISMCFSTI